MKKIIICCLLAVGWMATPASADVIWRGAGADAQKLFAEDNWDFSGSAVTAINFDVPVNDTVVVAFRDIDSNDYSSIGASSFPTFSIGDSQMMLMIDAMVTTDATGGFAGNDDGADLVSRMLLRQGSVVDTHFIGNGLEVDVDGTSRLVLRSDSLPVDDDDEGSKIFLRQGGQLQLDNGTQFADIADRLFASNEDGEYVSFASDASIVTISGNTATGNFVAVPEPGAIALLLGTGLLGLTRRRRR